MTQQAKLRVRVYSDREVENPVAYYNATFRNYTQYWKLIENNEPNCILCETPVSYDLDESDLSQLDDLYDVITPEMYQSSSRSYIKVKS